jgi:nitrogen fixation-related uncharacterized protein
LPIGASSTQKARAAILGSMSSTRWHGAPAAAAACAAVLAAPVAAWWLVGDQSSEGFVRDDLDYVVTPPDWSATSVRLAGIVAVAVIFIGAIAILWAIRSGRFDRRWNRVVLVLFADAAFIGYAGRVATAGVIGANIGFGMVMLIGLVLFGSLTAWGVVARALSILSWGG